MVAFDWILLGLRILAAIILYSFLGVAFYLIWQSLKRGDAHLGQSQFDNRLRVVRSTQNQPLAVGDVLPLQSVTWLGYDSKNTVVFDDVATASHRICISRKNGEWWLENEGNNNGTLLNDSPLANPTPLIPGDVISLGDVRFRFE